jgi:regulator of replication initiation timing
MTKKQLFDEIDRLKDDLSELGDKYDDIKKVKDESEDLQGQLSIMRKEKEGLWTEVEWYRHVLEMIFVPADKIAELNRMREERRMGRY